VIVKTKVVALVDVQRGIVEDDRYGTSHVDTGDWRGLAATHWKRQLVSIPNARGGRKQEEPFEKDRRPHGDDWEARPRQACSANQCSLCCGLSVLAVTLIRAMDDVSLRRTSVRVSFDGAKFRKMRTSSYLIS
jgi:hypothetical protein